MRRALMLCTMVVVFTVLGWSKPLDKDVQYAPNRFTIKLWKEAGDLAPVTNNGLPQVWDQEINALLRKWNVVKVEPMFHNDPDDKIANQFEMSTFWRFWLDKEINREELDAVLADFSAAKLIEIADGIGIHPLFVDYLPNDPGWSTQQWYLQNTSGDHDIDAPQGWSIERGDTTAILGMTDTGVRYTHQDIAGHIWRNWAEVNGVAGVDDDGNGFVDDSIGYDFVTGITGCATGEDCSTPDNNPMDFNGHGTHTSGIAAGATNNGLGIAGVAGGGTGKTGARIMCLRIGYQASDGNGYVDMGFAASAFNYGRQKGVCAFNCSWGSSGNSAFVAAVNAAITAGISVCVAAGNSNTNSQSANYLSTRNDCIDVAATDASDLRASFSNYGTWVDVSAPGVNIYSSTATSNSSYAAWDGTSMATPCVTGEVGLLKSQHPNWNRTQIDTCIKNHTDNINALNPSYSGQLGTGRININLALLANAQYLIVTSPNGGEGWVTGESHNITWTGSGFSGNVNVDLNRTYPSGTWESLFANTTNDGTQAWTVTGPSSVTARIRVTSISVPTLTDVSDSNFTITIPYISVSVPNGGETWYTGESHTIYWSSVGFTGNVNVDINRNYPSGSWVSLFSNITNDGNEPWTVAGTSAAARIRVTSVSVPTISDTSNANFTILSPTITVSAPNGGETWYLGESHNITWTTTGLTGNVRIELNRTYSGGTWEILYDNIANSGTQAWTLSGAASVNARIRVSSYNDLAVNDVSNGDFTIATPYIHVDAPNGGEIWAMSSNHSLLWTSGGIAGNVLIRINRTYPGGTWDTLFASAANTGSTTWAVTGPVTANARIRISSISDATKTDDSDNNFTIIGQPPVITHDPLEDIIAGTGTITAISYSPQSIPVSVTMFYRLTGAGSFSSLPLSPTVNTNEFSANLSGFAVGSYEYYLRSVDNVSNASLLPTTAPTGFYQFDVGTVCGSLTAFDDGSADRYNWSEGTPGVGTMWAVKFGPVTTPYVLCVANIAVARSLPDAAHSRFHVYVYAADGAGGLPGTLLQSYLNGSVGNVVGGLPATTNWDLALTRDNLGQSLVVNSSEFYVAVGNDTVGKYEAFGRDTTGTNAHRSYFYDPCALQWYSEDAVQANAKPGNRMIRIMGYTLANPVVVIHYTPDVLKLTWTNLHAASYAVYQATDATGPFTYLQSTTDTTLSLPNVNAMNSRTFYEVKSANY